MKLFFYVWAFPNTLLGLLAVALAKVGGGNVVIVKGVVEAHGGYLPKLFKALAFFSPIPFGIAAITLGHVIIGQNQFELDRCRRHEHVHVRQYERWGIFFIPAYFMASFIALLKGKDVYRGNYFEVEAFAVDDGQVET